MVVGEFTQEVDLAVIGGGPGGYAAAFRAAELGVQALIIDDREELGGICLHCGCIPSKTLLHIAENIRAGEHAAQFGVKFVPPQIDLDAVRAWVAKTKQTLGRGLSGEAKRLGVEFIQGRASFEDSRRLNVRDSRVPRVQFRRAIIATGSAPLPHPVLDFDEERVITPHQALEIDVIPESLLVVGHNYMAVELASMYAALGSAVTLVDEAGRLLPEADADLTRPMLRRLEGQLAAIGTGVRIADATASKDGVRVTFDGAGAPTQTTFDRAVIAIGQGAAIGNLGLDRAGVECDESGFIVVNGQMRTSNQRLFAVGDATGDPLLADHAMLQGRIAAEVAAGWNSSMERGVVASVIFTDPQVAWCGVTEEQAKAGDVAHRVVKVPWGASGRAVGMGRTDGLTKIIYDTDTKLILGMGVSGAGASELISQGVLAIEMGAVIDDLAGIVHPHPTFSELLSEAAHRIEQPAESAEQ